MKDKGDFKMKFKVGDRVREIDIGNGTIIAMDDNYVPYLVSFDDWNCGHDGNGVSIKIGRLPKNGVRNCWWCAEEDLTLLSSEPTITEHIAPERAYGKEEVREVKRKAKVGEYVKVVNASGLPDDEYKNGDILQIVAHDKDIEPPEKDVVFYKNKRRKYLHLREYVVLENYKPKKTQLTLDNGEYGVVGQKTTLVDLYGNELYVGDTVKLYNNKGLWGEFSISHNDEYGDFVMSIAGVSGSIKNGVNDDGWVIIKERSYKDFKDGDVVDDVKYTLTEIE